MSETRSLRGANLALEYTIFRGVNKLRILELIASTETDQYAVEFYRAGTLIEVTLREKDALGAPGATLITIEFDTRELLESLANVAFDAAKEVAAP